MFRELLEIWEIKHLVKSRDTHLDSHDKSLLEEFANWLEEEVVMEEKICPYCNRSVSFDAKGFHTHGPGKDGSFACPGSRNIKAAEQADAVDASPRAEKSDKLSGSRN